MNKHIKSVIADRIKAAMDKNWKTLDVERIHSGEPNTDTFGPLVYRVKISDDRPPIYYTIKITENQ